MWTDVKSEVQHVSGWKYGPTPVFVQVSAADEMRRRDWDVACCAARPFLTDPEMIREARHQLMPAVSDWFRVPHHSSFGPRVGGFQSSTPTRTFLNFSSIHRWAYLLLSCPSMAGKFGWTSSWLLRAVGPWGEALLTWTPWTILDPSFNGHTNVFQWFSVSISPESFGRVQLSKWSNSWPKSAGGCWSFENVRKD